MKKYILAAIAVFAAAVPVGAADIGSFKDSSAIVVTGTAPAPVWTGVYVGGQFGYGNTNHELKLSEKHDTYCFDQFGNQLTEGESETLVNTTVAPADSFDPIGHDVKDTSHGLSFAFNAAGTCVNTPGEGNLPTTGGIYADDSIAIDGNSRTVASLDGLNSHGFVGGGTVGFDYAVGRFLIGAFGSYNFADISSSGNLADVASFSVEKGDEWSVGARAGIIAGQRTLFYGLIAYTETEYDFSARVGHDRASKSIDFKGVTVGGGIEYALTDNVFVGAEYTHTFYDKETVAVFNLDDSPLPGHRYELSDQPDEDKIMITGKLKGSLF